MLFGFSTGVFYRTGLNLLERINILKRQGVKALELNFLNVEELDDPMIDELTSARLADFKCVSFHAPAPHTYIDDEATKSIFKKIENLHRRLDFDSVVFHPDPKFDFEIFNRVNFPVSFENMDIKKNSFQTPSQLEEVLKLNTEYKLTLDVAHIFSLDSSMKLAGEFWDRWSTRIHHIHLSGYNGFHVPIFKTKQVEILNSIKINSNVPIIVESVLASDELVKEKDYILSYFK